MDNEFKIELEEELSSIFGDSFAGLVEEEFTDRDGDIWLNLTVLLKDEGSFEDAHKLMKATSAVRRLERQHSVEALSIPYYTNSSEHTGHAA